MAMIIKYGLEGPSVPIFPRNRVTIFYSIGLKYNKHGFTRGL